MSEEEANDVRRRMQLLRTNLKSDAQQVAEDVRTVSDWKYYVRKYPWSSAAVAMVAGYLLVPKRNPLLSPSPELLAKLVDREKLVVQRRSEAATKAGVMASLGTFVAHNLARAAVGYVKQNVLSALQASSSPKTEETEAGHFKSSRFPK